MGGGEVGCGDAHPRGRRPGAGGCIGKMNSGAEPGRTYRQGRRPPGMRGGASGRVKQRQTGGSGATAGAGRTRVRRGAGNRSVCGPAGSGGVRGPRQFFRRCRWRARRGRGRWNDPPAVTFGRPGPGWSVTTAYRGTASPAAAMKQISTHSRWRAAQTAVQVHRPFRETAQLGAWPERHGRCGPQAAAPPRHFRAKSPARRHPRE